MKTTGDIIDIIIAGGLLGILGQGIRMAIGLKKLTDSNAQKSIDDHEALNSSRLLTSLFIGFIAGALFLLIKNPVAYNFKDREFIFTVIAAGYSGSDFIEGLFTTTIAKIGSSANSAVATKSIDEATNKSTTVSTTAPPAENLVVENEAQINNSNIQG